MEEQPTVSLPEIEVVDLPVSHVYARLDARKIVPKTVDNLIESIKEVGILNPIRVRAAQRYHSGILCDVWEINAGVHRYEAVRRLGLETIPCIIGTEDDLHAELTMIDENICRAELSEAERARQMTRRKEIYEILHPETVTGKHANRANQYTKVEGRQNGDLPLKAERFTAATAKAIGKNERTVQRIVERGEKIVPEAIHELTGTHLDTSGYLDMLKNIPREKQLEKVREDLKNVVMLQPRKQARLPKSDAEVEQDQFNAFIGVWNKASPRVRDRIREFIDRPVMDGNFA